MLTDADVLEMRRIARQTGRTDIKKNAEHYGVSYHVLQNAMCGRSFAHLNDQEAPMVSKFSKHEEQEKARALYKSGKSFDEIVTELGVAKSSVSVWCRDLKYEATNGEVYHHSLEVRTKVREMYQNGHTYKEITRETGVSKSTAIRWLDDLTEVRLAKLESARDARRIKRNQPKAPKNGAQILTNEEVVEMRRSVRADGFKNWRKYANQYKVSIAVVSSAMRGITFKQVNHIEPPIDKDSIQQTRYTADANKNKKPDSPLVIEVMRLRRENHKVWTYKALAELMSKRTNRRYGVNHVRRLIAKRDPALAAIQDPQIETARTITRKLTPGQIKHRAIALRKLNDKKKQPKEGSIEQLLAQEDAREEALRVLALARNTDISKLAAVYV